MQNNQLDEIFNSQKTGRDLLVDELNDEIESGEYSPIELQVIVTQLL